MTTLLCLSLLALVATVIILSVLVFGHTVAINDMEDRLKNLEWRDEQ